jgi:tetratricopeptide (TPR) repeat protein
VPKFFTLNKRLKPHWLFALSLACASQLSVAQQPPSPPRVAPQEPSSGGPEIDLSWPILRFLLQAELFARQGEPGRASDMFLELGRRIRDLRLIKRAVETALNADDYARAEKAAQAWTLLVPQDRAPRALLENLQLQTGDPEKNEPLLARRLEAARANGQLADAYNQIRSLLLRQADKKKSLAVLDRLSAADLNQLSARLARADLAIAADEYDRALQETTAARAIDPSSERAVLTESQVLARDPAKAASATKLLSEFLQANPKAQQARFVLARQLLVAEKYTEAKVHLERLEADNQGDSGILLALAQTAYQSKARDQARGYLEKYVALPEAQVKDKGAAYLFLSDIAEQDKRLDQALEWANKVPEDSAQRFNALLRQAVLMGKNKQTKQANDALDAAKPTNNEQKLRLVQTRAILQRDAGQHSDAFKTLMAGLQESPDEADLLYDLGMAAEKVSNIDVMEASFRKLIKLRPDSAHAYNALGYSLADRSLKLDDAYELIKKALTLAPTDSHIVDSLGWVYYRKGNLPKALEALRKAYAMAPETDVAAHLGEVLWSSGKRQEARKIWRDAKQRDPANETLLETLKRLKVSDI